MREAIVFGAVALLAACAPARAPRGSQPYTVRLAIDVEDRKGMLAELSKRIADINTNITNVEARTGDQRGRIDVTVEINDVKHLEHVIKSVRGVAGVLNVERTAPIPERR